MTEPPHALDPSRAPVIARVIHGAIGAGVVLLLLVFLFLGSLSSTGFAPQAQPALRLVGLALLLIVIFVTRVLRGRILPAPRGADPGEWWVTNLRRAIVVWAVAEGGGLGALTLGFIAGDRPLMITSAFVALLILFMTRPTSLVGGRRFGGPVDVA